MRITKTMAEAAAKEMTEPHFKKYKEEYAKLSATIKEMYLQTVPAEILSAFKDFKSYVNCRHEVYVEGYSLNRESINTDGVPSRDYMSPTVSVESKEQALEIAKSFQNIESLRKDARSKRDEIEKVLFALRTLKNVEAQFPEAVPFLKVEPPVRNLPVNLNKLREEFKKK